MNKLTKRLAAIGAAMMFVASAIYKNYSYSGCSSGLEGIK